MANVKPHFSVDDVAKAIEASRGIKTAAAKSVGCSTDTIDRYIAKYPTVAVAYQRGRASIVDVAESVLLDKLKARQWDAAKFVLTTLGKDRGWGQTLDVRLELSELARQIADETGQRVEDVLPVVVSLADERRRRRSA